MSAIKITDKELERIYSGSEEMSQIQKIFIKKFNKSTFKVKGYTDEFKEWFKENWLYVKDKKKIAVVKNHKLISKNAFRLDFKWTPELRFLKTFNTYLVDKLANQEVKKGNIIGIKVYEHDFNLEVIAIFSKDCDNKPIQVDETVQLKVNEDTIISFDAPKIDNEKLMKKFRQLFKVSSHVRLDMLKNILDLPVNQFIDKIAEWKNEFNFEIKDDYIYFTKEDPSELIDKLEKSYAIWKDSEKKPEKIIYKIENRQLKSTFNSSNQQLKERIQLILERLERPEKSKKEVLPARELNYQSIKDIPTGEILTDPTLRVLRDYDLDDYFKFFSSSDVPNRLRHYQDGVFFSMLQEYGLFNKLNNALNSNEYVKCKKAFDIYQLLLLKEILPVEIKKILKKNFRDLAIMIEFQESAEIPFYGSQMKEDDKHFWGGIERMVQFTYRDNHVTDISIKNSIFRPTEAFGTFNYEMLGKLESLKALDISDDMFESIPPSFKTLKKLTRLNIRSHSLNKTPDFIGLDSLESLSLNCEKLLEFPINIGALKKLKHFNLVSIPMMERSTEQMDRYAQKTTKKGLNGIPESIGELNNLISLSLICDFTVPPAFIQHLKSLKVLGLKSNFINEVPEWIGNLTNLERIDLSENQIRFLPESFGSLNKVTELNLLHNQLQSLPESFGKLTAIKKLNLYNNEITHLPESIGKLKHLEWIHLRKNRLLKLPKSIGDISSLKTLSLGENQLIELPKSIGNLTSLESLDLFNNKLTEIPSTIGNLTSLKELNLNKNQLSNLPKEIGNLKSLEKLNLSDNLLTRMELFRDLTSLKELGLSNNPYSEIKGLEKMANLTRLYLVNTKIPEKIIDELGGLRKEGYAYHVAKFVEYCEHQINEGDIKDFREEAKASILENFLKEELKKYELEDDIYYELIRPELISKNFTQILHMPEFKIDQFLDIIKKTPLLTEKYLEILEHKKSDSEYNRCEFLKKLMKVSTKSDLKRYIFDIFRIPEQMKDIPLRVRSFCAIINKIKSTELFEVHYNFIESQFKITLQITFRSRYSIGSFYNLIEAFKDTKLFEKQYELIQEKFIDFLIIDFPNELRAQANYNYDDVEYWRVRYISAMIKNLKGTPLLKDHFIKIEALIHNFIKNDDRVQILMEELHQNNS
ncbi:MAG: leucine-rich repeat domain-containing protein [Candidatus Hermodarchaeota archaeon]